MDSIGDKAEKYSGYQTVNHLFIMAASMESLVIRERQILRQVKDAYTEENRVFEIPL